MIQLPANSLLTPEALREKRIAFDLGVGNLDGDLTAGAEIRAAIDGGCGTSGNQVLQGIVIELAAGEYRGQNRWHDFHHLDDTAGGLKKS
jgi:hypothetical protein